MLPLKLFLLVLFHCPVLNVFQLSLYPHSFFLLADLAAVRAAITVHHCSLFFKNFFLPEKLNFLVDLLLSGNHLKVVLLLFSFGLLDIFSLFLGSLYLVIDDFLDEMAVLASRRSGRSLCQNFLLCPCGVFPCLPVASTHQLVGLAWLCSALRARVKLLLLFDNFSLNRVQHL